MHNTMAVLLALAVGCAAPCPTAPIAESDHCYGGCQELEDLPLNCIGSHTEQTCTLGAQEYIVTGGDDAVRQYFDADGGTMVAVQQLDPSQREVAEIASCEASMWFGEDLTGCTLQGDPVQVSCTGNANGE